MLLLGFQMKYLKEKVRHCYTSGVLVKSLNCFTTEMLNTITDVAVGEICVLFQPQTDRDSVAVSSTPPPLTPPAEEQRAQSPENQTLLRFLLHLL
eukprot:superscaffoldBa00002132_g13299